MWCDVMWYDVMWYDTIPYYKISYHVISYHDTMSYHIIYHIIYHITSHHITSHISQIISYLIISYIIYHTSYIIHHIISYHIISYMNVIFMLISQPGNMYTLNWEPFRCRKIYYFYPFLCDDKMTYRGIIFPYQISSYRSSSCLSHQCSRSPNVPPKDDVYSIILKTSICVPQQRYYSM